MRVCLDTNVLLQLSGRTDSFRAIRNAIVSGRLELVVSNEILLEYEEAVTSRCGPTRWQQIETLLARTFQLHANILFLEPQFRFQVITSDLDDNKFVDCAIAAQADFIVTEDAHFQALSNSGYKPKPISPANFINYHLTERP